MTQATHYYGDENGQHYVDDGYGNGDGYLDYAHPQTDASLNESGYLARSNWLCLPMLLPMTLCGISYAAGGQPMLTDVAFIFLVIICLANIARELFVFQRRFGVGGLLLWGGVLIWFCHDYFTNWFGINFSGLTITPWVVAKAGLLHMVFIFFMAIGLQIKKGKWLEKCLHAVPEPRSRSIYFALVLITFFIGMIPFLFFTNEPFYIAIWKSFWAGRSGTGATFTAGRTGNLNYSWGAYLAQLADIGMLGAVLAAFHAIIVARQIWQRAICFFIWLIWLGIAFGTGTRGFTVFLALPVIMLVFLKYSHRAAQVMRRLSIRAYVMAGLVAVFITLLVQVQGAFRNEGFSAESFDEVKLTELKGNEMFTTSLFGMAVFPDQKDFFYSRIPGEGMLRAPFVELYWLIISPIPRVLWHDKPVSQVNVWYNNAVTGQDRGAEGTTISNGAVGHPYFRYGAGGVCMFGVFYGWMMAVTERALRNGMHRPMALLFSLAFGTFVFRCYRDLWWHNLYPIIIAGSVITMLVWISNTFFGGSVEHPDGAGSGDLSPLSA